MRAAVVMGPHLADSGGDLINGSWRAFMAGAGRDIGPGHVGVSETVVGVHFCDGSDSFSAKPLAHVLDWDDGDWPAPVDVVARHWWLGATWFSAKGLSACALRWRIAGVGVHEFV